MAGSTRKRQSLKNTKDPSATTLSGDNNLKVAAPVPSKKRKKDANKDTSQGTHDVIYIEGRTLTVFLTLHSFQRLYSFQRL